MSDNPRIGVTERGDAAVDLSWTGKLANLDMAVIITKNPAKPEFQKALLEHADKCLLHATITGWGGSVLEPNVPTYKTALDGVDALVAAGFPKDHVVIRIDPIMPWNTEPSMHVFREACARRYHRFRVSILDEYAHMKERFHKKNLATPSDMGIDMVTAVNRVNRMLHDIRTEYPDITVEACAEPRLDADQKGCINPEDMALFDLPVPEAHINGRQRRTCLCCDGKRELLTNRHPCAHGCLYCYWKN